MEVGFLSVEILCFILLLLLSTVSNADINLGSSLKPTSNQNNNNIWRSPNGNFSLQFIPVSSSSSFSVAITFTGVPIWKAGGESGVVDSNSRFDFLNDGNLCLINGLGTIIWQSNTSKLGITTATLDNSGNLSLKNGTTTTVWSTFQNPTDTIVPFQNFTAANVLRSGNYSFALNSSGYVTLRWNNKVIYWNPGNSLLNSTLPTTTTPILKILPNGMIQINGFSILDSGYIGEDSLGFLKLDSDGNLRFYISDRGSGRAIERWKAVSDQCKVYGLCGNMGMCSYKEGSNTTCGCPSENFEFTDENDPRKGCKRKVEIEDCPAGNTVMLELDHTQFLTYEPELSTQEFFAGGLSGCSSNCLNNRVSCQASTAMGDGYVSGLCYLKTSSFISGYQSPALRSISYVKVCRPEMPNGPPPSSPLIGPPPSSPLIGPPPIQTYKLHVWAFVMIVFVTIVVLVLLEGGLWFWCCRNSS